MTLAFCELKKKSCLLKKVYVIRSPCLSISWEGSKDFVVGAFFNRLFTLRISRDNLCEFLLDKSEFLTMF